MPARRIRRRPVGRPTAETARLLENALLQVASELFQEKGFARTTMREISERAAASRQSLYARFPDKTALFEALMRKRSAALLSDVTEILATGSDTRATLVAVGMQLVTTYLKTDLQRLHQIVIAEAGTCPQLAKTFYELGPGRGRIALCEYIKRQTAVGALSADNPEWAADQFLGSLVGAIVLRSTVALPAELVSNNSVADWVAMAVGAFLAAYSR